jgi:hypothetical protein
MADTTTNLAAASLTFSVLSFLLLTVAVLFTLFPNFSNMVRSSANIGSGGGMFGNMKMVGALLGAFSPDIAILSGFISDIMNGSFRYSVTSFIAIITVILHWVVAGLIYGFGKPSASTTPSVPTAVAAPLETAMNAVSTVLGTGAAPGSVFTATGEKGLPHPQRQAAVNSQEATQRLVATGLVGKPRGFIPRKGPGSSVSQLGSRFTGSGGALSLSDFNPCSIRGMGMFDISKSPMGMAALTSVFTVYLLDMYVGDKRSKLDTGVYLLFSSVVYGLNVFAYKEFECYGSTYGEVAKATILPIVIGLAGGAAGYSVLQTTFPTYLPLDGHAIGSPASPGTIVPGTARCNAPNDQDQFVCDAYKDGKRISTATVA